MDASTEPADGFSVRARECGDAERLRHENAEFRAALIDCARMARQVEALAGAAEERVAASEARVAALEAGLAPFAEFATRMDSNPETKDVDDYCPITRWLLHPMMGHCRRAAELLRPEPKESAMKLTVTRPVEIEAMCVEVVLPVRYGTEDIPEDCPGRKGDTWRAVIDLDTGRVRQWPKGATAEVEMKVVDGGVYKLFDTNGDLIAERRDYVPPCVPGEYGDYVSFAIDGEGVIENWGDFCTPEAVAESFFPVED